MCQLSIVAPVVALGAVISMRGAEAELRLPRGLTFDFTAEEAERANALADRLRADFENGNYISTTNITHDIVNCDQVCSNWCWATSATMAASAFGGGSDCAGEEARVAGHAFGASCDSSCSSVCNHGGTMTETCDGIEFLSGQKYKFTPNALQPDELDNALRVGPVVLGEQWSLGGGHAITISGVSAGTYIGHDPEGYPISTDYMGLLRYSPPYCQYPCFGTWMATSSPSGVASTLSPTPSPSSVRPGATPCACRALSADFTDEWCSGNCAVGFCPADLCDCGAHWLV